MMARGPQWKPTKETARRFRDISILRGGPEAGVIAEHAHATAEVSVHFRPIAPGRVFPEHVHLYAPNQPHSGGWKAGHEVIVFLLSPQLLEELAEESSGRGRFEIRPFTRRRDKVLEDLGRVALDEYRPIDRLSGFYAESIGNVLAGYVVRNFAEVQPRAFPENALSDDELRLVRRFIEERIEIGFKVEELAEAMGLRPRQFAQRLRLATHLSPWRYVEAQRFSIAKRMLGNGKITIAEVAARLGFVDQSHFTNAFRRMSGVTPNAYRRETFNSDF